MWGVEISAHIDALERDGALLADLWDDLVLPRAVRSAWAPLVSLPGEAEG